MKKSNKASALAMIATIALPVTASAQTASACITIDQVSSIGVAFLPGIMNKIATKCEAILPQDASLLQSGRSVAASYKDQAIAARAEAFVAIKAIAGKELPPEMTADAIFPFVEALVAGEIGKMEAESTCPVANNLWAALKPLPLENWGEIIAAIISAQPRVSKPSSSSKIKGRSSPRDNLNICPYTSVDAAGTSSEKSL